MEKVQWNSIDKKQNGLKYSKNDKSSTLPRHELKRMSEVRFQPTLNGLEWIKIWYYIFSFKLLVDLYYCQDDLRYE